MTALTGHTRPRSAGPTTVVWSPDRELSVCFGGRGELISMSFNGTKYQRMAPDELAALIVETLNAGREAHLHALGADAEPAARPPERPAGRAAALAATTPTEMLDFLLAPLFGSVVAAEPSVPKPAAPERTAGHRAGHRAGATK